MLCVYEPDDISSIRVVSNAVKSLSERDPAAGRLK